MFDSRPANSWTLLIKDIPPEALAKMQLSENEEGFIQVYRTLGMGIVLKNEEMGQILGITPKHAGIVDFELKRKLTPLIKSVGALQAESNGVLHAETPASSEQPAPPKPDWHPRDVAAPVIAPGKLPRGSWVHLLNAIPEWDLARAKLSWTERSVVAFLKENDNQTISTDEASRALKISPGYLLSAKHHIKTKLGALLSIAAGQEAAHLQEPNIHTPEASTATVPLNGQAHTELAERASSQSAETTTASHHKPQSTQIHKPFSDLGTISPDQFPLLTPKQRELVEYVIQEGSNASAKIFAIKHDTSTANVYLLRKAIDTRLGKIIAATVQKIHSSAPSARAAEEVIAPSLKSDPAHEFIPEEWRPLWNHLKKRGASQYGMESFERYLSGNESLTADQRELYCQTVNAFPGANQKYSPLADLVMNRLHEKFSVADDQQKSRILWVARSLFSALNNKTLEYRFDRMMGGQGDIYDAQLHSTMDISVRSVLEKPPNDSTLAFMYASTKLDMLDLRRTIVGREKAASHQDRVALLHPTSLSDTKGGHDKSRSLEEILPQEMSDPVDILLSLEAQKRDQTTLNALCNGSLAFLRPREQDFIKLYVEMMTEERTPRFKDIGERMGVTESRANQLYASSIEKIKQHFSDPSVKFDSLETAPVTSDRKTEIHEAENPSSRKPFNAFAGPLPKTLSVFTPRQRELIDYCLSAGPGASAMAFAAKTNVTAGGIYSLKRDINAKLTKEPTPTLQYDTVKPLEQDSTFRNRFAKSSFPRLRDLGNMLSSDLKRLSDRPELAEMVNECAVMMPRDISESSLSKKLGITLQEVIERHHAIQKIFGVETSEINTNAASHTKTADAKHHKSLSDLSTVSPELLPHLTPRQRELVEYCIAEGENASALAFAESHNISRNNVYILRKGIESRLGDLTNASLQNYWQRKVKEVVPVLGKAHKTLLSFADAEGKLPPSVQEAADHLKASLDAIQQATDGLKNPKRRL